MPGRPETTRANNNANFVPACCTARWPLQIGRRRAECPAAPQHPCNLDV